MSEIRMRAVHPACTVSAEEARRLALGVLDAVRAMRSAFSERHPGWIRSEDGTWYVVILTAEQFGEAKAREEAAAAARRHHFFPAPPEPRTGRAVGLSATVDPDGRLRPVETRDISLVAHEPEPGPRLGQPDEIEGCE